MNSVAALRREQVAQALEEKLREFTVAYEWAEVPETSNERVKRYERRITPRINIPDAPKHLRYLLHILPTTTDGFIVTQHLYQPQSDQWYCGWGASDLGPFERAEMALTVGSKWLHNLFVTASTACDEAERKLREREDDRDLPDACKWAFEG